MDGCGRALWSGGRCMRCYRRRRRSEEQQRLRAREQELERQERERQAAERRAAEQAQRQRSRVARRRSGQRPELAARFRQRRGETGGDRYARSLEMAEELGLSIQREDGRPAVGDRTRSKVVYSLRAPEYWGAWLIRWLTPRMLEQELQRLWAVDVAEQGRVLRQGQPNRRRSAS